MERLQANDLREDIQQSGTQDAKLLAMAAGVPDAKEVFLAHSSEPAVDLRGATLPKQGPLRGHTFSDLVHSNTKTNC